MESKMHTTVTDGVEAGKRPVFHDCVPQAGSLSDVNVGVDWKSDKNVGLDPEPHRLPMAPDTTKMLLLLRSPTGL
jgi:hypothetical protein